MNISAPPSALKVINEVMKSLKDIEVHTYVYIVIHTIKSTPLSTLDTIYIATLLYDDYSGINWSM